MIELNYERLSARGVDIGTMVQAMQGDNFSLSGGQVREGGKLFYVRSMAKYQSLDEIENISIRTPNGEVRLGLFQESGANIVEVCERVEEALREIESDPIVGGKLKFDVFLNQGEFIQNSIHNLETTGLWGGLFAAMVLLFFLRAFRMTAIITLSIPLCVMITITTLYFIDWSLNLLTMMGLMVGVGMVVDNAIVILENIYRMRAKDLPPKEASIVGASEVGLAITMATLTTVVVFLPLMLMNGSAELTFFLARIGVPVVVSLVGSLFVALIFIPQAAFRFGGSEVKVDPKPIRWMRDVYSRMLKWTLAHRRDAFLIAVFLLGTLAVPTLKRGDSGGSALNDFHVRFYFPKDFSIEETSDTISEVEDFLNL